MAEVLAHLTPFAQNGDSSVVDGMTEQTFEKQCLDCQASVTFRPSVMPHALDVA